MTLPAGIHVAWGRVCSGDSRREVSRALLAQALPGGRVASRCPLCAGEHGRVHVEGDNAAVSVAYVPNWAVIAMTRDHERVGIDAVPADAAGLERVIASGADPARAWARVEAVLKADGRGLALDPALVDVVPTGRETWTARVDGRMWRGADVGAPDGVVAAVAVPSSPPR